MPKPHNSRSGKVIAALKELKEAPVFTHDLPTLRYGGPHRVFLWDGCRTSKGLASLGFQEGVHFRQEYYRATTSGKFLPCYNTATSGYLAGFKYYIPITGCGLWTDVVDLPKGASLENEQDRPISGRSVLFSCEGMQMLDEYYENTCVFRRSRLFINCNTINKADRKSGEPHAELRMMAWVYLNPLTSITRYDAHSKKHTFLGGINPARLPRVHHNMQSLWIANDHNKVG